MMTAKTDYSREREYSMMNDKTVGEVLSTVIKEQDIESYVVEDGYIFYYPTRFNSCNY